MPDFRLPPEARARIRAVLATTRPSFRAHLDAAGLNPAIDLRGADLRRVRFHGEDLTDFDFTGADLRETDIAESPGGYILSETTQLPAGFIGRLPLGFSTDEVKRRLLAREPIDLAWRPFVTELTLGLPADARRAVYDTETRAKTREAAAGTYLDTAAPLAQFPNLARLDLWGTEITDLTPLATLANLQSLDLRYTQVIDLTPLAALAKLQSLNLYGTQVTDLTPLAALPNLQSLILWGTQVTHLAPLAALANLQSLGLNQTQVTDLTPLSTLTNLQALSISGTKVTDLTPLAALPNLKLLALRNLPPGIENTLPRRAEIEILR